MLVVPRIVDWEGPMVENANLSRIVEKEAFHWGEDVSEAYHGAAERDMQRQWRQWIWPLLKQFPIDYTQCVDFAAGYGRNTSKLLEQRGHVTAVDVNPDCVKHLKERFSTDRVTVVLNNGVNLSELASEAYTFLYSFDAMVHFDVTIIASYLPEFARVLRPGSYAFIHHSNYSAAAGGDFTQNPHWRNYMSADLFKHLAMKSGFEVVKQELIDWELKELDCLTVMRKL
jgi:ubiquinone/menaquinone biosynthesis C-methylase UbiE